MQTVVQKWGNSLGIRIPSSYVKTFSLKQGSSVDIVEEDGKIVIIPKKITLADLLDKIHENNLHEPIESGPSVGKEEW
uniref:AbrB/MazE/SpoVT family DNA-binding domain-containing protein n=1 Tax=Gracilinema caldarium TaxID=215591 RepID=A0A7C3I0S8_9SPIR